MHVTRVAKALPFLAATLANARLAKLGLPEEIKPGETFNITVEQAIGIPMVEVYPRACLLKWSTESHHDATNQLAGINAVCHRQIRFYNR